MSSQSAGDPGMEQCWNNIEGHANKAVTALRDFARSKEKGFQTVISLSSSELDGFLKEFYLVIKESVDEELSGTDNLNRLRTDLQKFFLKFANVDISVGPEFSESNGILDEVPPPVNKDVNMKGQTVKKHVRQRTFTFDTNELRKIYMSDTMNLDKPETLQNKVFFDVCMYICNRGKDFLRLMTKSDFEVSTDQNGIRYVWLKYDSKFSYQEVAGGMTFDGSTGSQIGERMYERKGDPKCPVLSYTTYTNHLHPMSDAFWQRPKRSILPTDVVWYDNISIGNSTLNKLMNRITQSAGLPDSYQINAIKSSYIPVIESICRSALFGSQQFRRILQMKHSNHMDMHLVRKRHSEGSLSIASALSGSPLFRPRLSEPRLPVAMFKSEEDALRCSSASPILRGNSWPDSISPHIQMPKSSNSVDRGDNPPEAGYPMYRKSEYNITHGYSPAYSDTGQNGQGHPERGEHMSPARDYPYREEAKKTEKATAHILHAKEKCLDIVHSLEVRDIKSFINWMKTFEVKHGPRGLMVTCQPVNTGEIDPKTSTSDPQNNMYNTDKTMKQEIPEKRMTPSNEVHGQVSNGDEKRSFNMKSIDCSCCGGTFCSVSEISPLKVTIPNQETVLLTGLSPTAQVLVHNRDVDYAQSCTGSEKFQQLHKRVFTSCKDFDLEQVNAVTLRQESLYNGIKQEMDRAGDINRSNSFKEERSIPMKKRTVVDQLELNHTHPYSQSIVSSQSYSGHSQSTPPLITSHPSSSQRYIQETPVYMQPAAAHPVSQPMPDYRQQMTDPWGYIPQYKRQKFGVQANTSREDGPLDLIKQS